ncbi:hypothetical protein GF345_05970 [Candidatus Woesearchaeota archaeon]|nr:hypothetical protein [Candidatus Woesearchaeota archaeon]
MVTILDSGLLEHFTLIFSLIFVIAIIYGIFSMGKVFGDNKGLHALIALVVGLLVIMVPDITNIIAVMIPWFTLLFIFILFLLITYKIFGATDSDIMSVLRVDNVVIWVIIIIAIVIVIASFSNVYGQKLLESGDGETVDADDTASIDSTASSSFGSNVSATFFHPKVLGMLFILIVAVFTISLLAMKTKA